MQRRKAKSRRHVYAAQARWRAAQVRADAEREAGVPDRQALIDNRQPFDLPLKSAGYLDLRIEPRLGYVAWRAVDAETGKVVDCAALKTLLHNIAGRVPRMLAARNFD